MVTCKRAGAKIKGSMKEQLKVLLLEDNEADAEIIKRLLKKAKPFSEFRLAADKPSFINALDEFHPDLILSDNSMPQFSAKDALEITHLYNLRIPFIMVTGSATEEFAAGIIKLGADDYIIKDRMARLPMAIDAALKQKKAEREKQEAEKKILESENNLKAIFDNSSDGFLLMDVNGIVKALNKNSAQYGLMTVNREIQVGNTIYDFIEDDRKSFFKQNILRVLKGEKIYYDRTYTLKNGGRMWIEFSIIPVIEKDKIAGICVNGRDITTRKKADTLLNTALKELSDYKIALDESSIVSITDPKGIITYVNNNFCKISKYSANELIGKNHRIVSSSFHEKSFIKNLWTTILKGEIWRNEVRNKAKDGDIFWLDTTIVPFLDSKKKPVQFVAINKDITEKKLIEQKLLSQKIQEQKRITRAMIIAQEKERNHLSEELHDNVNQILAGTKLYLGMIGTDKPQLKKMTKYPMELIDRSIEEIRLLCHRLATPLKNIDLNRMLKDLLNTLSSTSPIKTNLTYSLSSEILNDDLKLNIYRIIQEQINNIVKYSKAKNVQVSITEIDGILNITTKDDGVGFDITNKRRGIGISNMMHRIEL